MQRGNFTWNYALSRCKGVILPSSGAELSAELSLSELPEEAALFVCFFMTPFFSALPAFPFFLFLEPPTVHCKVKKTKQERDHETGLSLFPPSPKTLE